ncbi:glycosyltransferase family 2 protein [Enterovirga aerilata]|uniref:Glycosyltransferase family 2 protein n=1 Tax=Enterovirga aerilata TaxID=2730920 RepID=A0A849IBL5_9HYPH|nr:glycosyltransferase family 2 protein [Enterovirga sp. DB1703]NNM73367.1 glycosyltransferase family 2 protein [Enterovirga sp. DB1703]
MGGDVAGGRSDRPGITAVVVAFDSAEVLPACLGALHENGVEAVVVDNASQDGSAELAGRLGARVLSNRRNEGYGRACNRGAAVAHTPWLLVANPDVVLERNAAEALLRAAALYPDAGMLAPRIVEPDGRFFFQPRSLLAPYLPNPGGRRSPPEGDCCAPFLSGACFMIRRELFARLGGFDERIFLFYEDDDLCRRVADSGHALVHVHEAVARHVRGGSTRSRPGRVFAARWHLAWSRAYAARKWGLPGGAFRIFAVNGLKVALACLTFRRSLVERYAGSAAGAWAFLRGRTALEREGLPEPR